MFICVIETASEVIPTPLSIICSVFFFLSCLIFLQPATKRTSICLHMWEVWGTCPKILGDVCGTCLGDLWSYFEILLDSCRRVHRGGQLLEFLEVNFLEISKICLEILKNVLKISKMCLEMSNKTPRNF